MMVNFVTTLLLLATAEVAHSTVRMTVAKLITNRRLAQLSAFVN